MQLLMTLKQWFLNYFVSDLKADFVLHCNPQAVIHSMDGHFEWYNAILIGKVW